MVIPRERTAAVAGIPTTDALQTTADLILRVDRYSAVSVLDSALNQKLITPDEFAGIPALVRGRRGAVAARSYVAEANGLAQSPLETRVRLRCVDGRVRPDVLQHVICDADGYILGIGDMAWLRARIVAEADGKVPHALPQAIYQDRHRQNLLANAGWLILRFTWHDTLSPHYIPHMVREALRPRLLR
jgi:very-short-patch-repair endonuclease